MDPNVLLLCTCNCSEVCPGQQPLLPVLLLMKRQLLTSLPRYLRLIKAHPLWEHPLTLGMYSYCHWLNVWIVFAYLHVCTYSRSICTWSSHIHLSMLSVCVFSQISIFCLLGSFYFCKDSNISEIVQFFLTQKIAVGSYVESWYGAVWNRTEQFRLCGKWTWTDFSYNCACMYIPTLCSLATCFLEQF